MDSGLKERLVGAAVLIALGVWLIPWILDGRDTAGVVEPEATVTLPAGDSPAATRTRTISLADGSESRRTDQDEAGTGAEPATGTETATEDSPADTTDATAASEAPPASAVAASVATESGAAEISQPRPVGGQTAASDPEPMPDRAVATAAAPVDEAAGGSPSESEPSESEEGWFVQLGSFSEEDNAKRLAERVATFGYKAEVSAYRAGGRELKRVRVGPSASREAASVIASSLSAHGFVAQVVSGS